MSKTQTAPPAIRGHWPKGKRRNDGNARQLAKLIAQARERRLISHLAGRLGLARKTLYRWASGEDVPPQATIGRIVALLEDRPKI